MLHHISKRQKIIVMMAVMSALFLFALDQLIIATALGKIVEDFNSFSSLSWIVTAYLLTSTIATPIAGKFSDMFGRRMVLLVGITIFTLASLLSGSAGDINQLIFWRAVQGIGGGIITANAFAVIGDLFAPRERGRWQGIFGGVFGIASVIGPLLGGFLTDGHTIFGLTTSWRWTLWVNVPIGVIVFIIIAIFMPRIKHEAKPRVDYVGAGLLSVMLTAIILAADNTDKIFAGFMDASGWSLLAVRTALLSVAVLSLVVLVWVERKVREPIFNLDFFKNRNFSIFMTMSILNGAAFLGAILYITQFNQQVFGVSPSTAGLMIIPMVLGLVSSAAVSGQIMQRTGHYKYIMITGLIIAASGIFCLSFLTPTSSFLMESVIMVITGIGLGALLPTLNLAVQNEFAQRDLGAVTAATQLFRNLGSTVGVAIFGGILTAGIIGTLGNVHNIPYIKALSQQQKSSQNQPFDLKKADADTALTLNTRDANRQINDGVNKGFAKAQTQAEASANRKIDAIVAPKEAKLQVRANAEQQISTEFKKQKDELHKKQASFSHDVKYAFADSLRIIFYIAAGLMLIALAAAVFIREKMLRHGPEDAAPGVA
jgi:EmrB/QacA subfamily drug resistance transporter